MLYSRRPGYETRETVKPDSGERSVKAARSRAVLLTALVTVAVSPGAIQPLTAQPPAKSIWDGVYTEEQSSRGEDSYRELCGHCHRNDLRGGGSELGAPALVGPIFTARWTNKPLSALVLTIGQTMPYNAPDTLM